LGQQLEEIHTSIPGVSKKLIELLTLVRCFLWVMAAALGFHAVSGIVRANRKQVKALSACG
jgi:hypothetical protein